MLTTHGLLFLQGKGFPDLATSSFLNIIHAVRPHMPMYALVDFDPDGLSILRTYQVGSSSLMHEEHTIAPQLRWLGIRSDQIVPSTKSDDKVASIRGSQETGGISHCSSETPRARDLTAGSGTVISTTERSDDDLLQSSWTSLSTHARSTPLEALSQLTHRDRRMAISMLQGICQGRRDGDTDGVDQVRELQMMLMLNVKAEIQAVDNLGDITHWLDERLCV